jgi:hypothetical protein
MKRYLIAAAMAVLVLSLVNADDTGRAFIRTADTAPEAPPMAPMPMQQMQPMQMQMAPGPMYGMPSGPGCETGGCSNCMCGLRETDARVGLHPIFSKLFWWKKAKCKRCGGLFGPRCNTGFGQPDAFNPYPNGVPGTLVFPQHAFIRSPRDFWMADPK